MLKRPISQLRIFFLKSVSKRFSTEKKQILHHLLFYSYICGECSAKYTPKLKWVFININYYQLHNKEMCMCLQIFFIGILFYACVRSGNISAKYIWFINVSITQARKSNLQITQISYIFYTATHVFSYTNFIVY